ncbi:protein Spindly [Engraulis encrasicolus]|uniref:protein Spindly n=1 Tax=Engraulis encrasicolus TaxID=184585 RepID=UPI002FD3EE1A
MASSELEVLRRKLKEKEEACQKAAQYGLQLMDDQLNLQMQLDEQRKEMANAMEALEQEKYSLQREVELKTSMLNSVQSEFEEVKKHQRHLLEQQEAELGRNHAHELGDYKNKLERTKVELEEAQLAEKQLRHKLEVQGETLSSKTEELRAMTERAHETMSSEIMELQLQRMDMESAMADLRQELQEAQYRDQQQQLALSNLQRQLERLTEEKEEREKEAVSCYNSLEKARETNQELQIQLDQLLQKEQDPNSRGNSLFAEVEDKRAEMERQMIGMKVQYQSLQQQHAFSKQQMHRMKVQIAALMQLQGSGADSEQLERMQSLLSQKNAEIEALLTKVRQLESDQHMNAVNALCLPGDTQDQTYYTDLLQMKLSNSAKENEQLKKDLSLQMMKAFSESQRVMDMERKLFGTQQALKQSQGDNIKLQVKVEELRLKYEPNEVGKGRVQKRTREKLPVDVPLENQEPNLEVPAPPAKEAEMASCPKASASAPSSRPSPQETTVANPQQPTQPRETKCVRISEEPPVTIPKQPRSPSENSIETDDTEQKEESWCYEGRKRSKCTPIHVSSMKTMENECAQQ